MDIVTGSGKILLIDDEEMVTDIGQQLLQTLGYDVITAASGSEGVAAYRRQHDGIDMVILDMVMPDMSGWEAFDKLQQIDPAVKVLLSTGYSLDNQISQMLESGCRGYIQKPFRIQALSKKVHEIMSE